MNAAITSRVASKVLISFREANIKQILPHYIICEIHDIVAVEPERNHCVAGQVRKGKTTSQDFQGNMLDFCGISSISLNKTWQPSSYMLFSARKSYFRYIQITNTAGINIIPCPFIRYPFYTFQFFLICTSTKMRTQIVLTWLPFVNRDIKLCTTSIWISIENVCSFLTYTCEPQMEADKI